MIDIVKKRYMPTNTIYTYQVRLSVC